MTRTTKITKGMDIKHVRRRCLSLAAIIAFAVLLCGNNVMLVQADDQPQTPEKAEQQSLNPGKQEPIKGYPMRKRRIGGPTDVEWDLDNSFPKRGSLLELILRCQETHD